MLAILILGVLLHQSIANVQTKKVFYDVGNLEHVSSLFERFIITHEKRYTGEEKAKRFNVFRDTLQEINKLNHDHPDTVFGITRTADLTAEELVERNGVITPEQLADNYDCEVMGENNVHVDQLSNYQGLTPVHDQKDCNAGWAYSVSSAMEFAMIFQTQLMGQLSAQQLIDCLGGPQACTSLQTPSAVFSYLMKGQMAADDYLPSDKPGPCQYDSTRVVVNVTRCLTYNVSSEDILGRYVFMQGPIAVLIDASSRAFQSYKYGIFDDCEFNSTRLTHGVLLEGYQKDRMFGNEYRIIKNSYGLTWGELGYMRMKAGVNCLGFFNPAAGFAKVSSPPS